ncbi:MAG: glycosyltransferase family 2 protein [Elusimicrobiota bacterium]
MLISFIIPTLNRIEDLSKCVNSIIESYDNFRAGVSANDDFNIEILIVNQGEPLNRDSFASKEYLTIFNVNSKGSSVARNYAVNRCKGDFLVFIDDDAQIGKEFISVLKNTIMLNKSNVYCGRIYDPVSKKYFSDFFENSGSKYLNYFDYRHFKLSSIIIKNSILRKAGSFNEVFGINCRFGGAGESDLFFRIKQMGEKIFYSADLVFFHPFQLGANKAFNYASSIASMLIKQAFSDLPRSFIYLYLLSDIIIRSFVRTCQYLLFPESLKQKNEVAHYGKVLKGSLFGIYDYIKYRRECNENRN